MRSIEFTPIGFAEFAEWIALDRKMAARVARLIADSAADPFRGIGKPEPLKGMQGAWSRRIDQEHRLVYRVTDTHLIVLTCRAHYA